MEVTNAGELDALKKGEVVKLPSFDEGVKFVARLKRPSLLTLCKVGTIPNTLIATAQKIFEGEKHGDIIKYSEILHLVAEAALVEPGYESVKDVLTDEQLTAIFNYTQMGVMGLTPFRKLREKLTEFKTAGSSSKGK